MIRGQFFRYCLVGAVGFLVDASILELLHRALDVGLYSARVVSYLCAATVAWALHRTITFPESRAQGSSGQWMRFVALNAAGAGLNYGVYAVLVTLFQTFATVPSLAVAVGSVVALLFNFLTARSLVFTSQPAMSGFPRSAAVFSALGYAAIVAPALSVLWMAMLLAVNYLSTYVPQSLIEKKLERAFADGSLVPKEYLPYDTRIGPHQYNDCLVLTIALLQDGPSIERALSPRIVGTAEASSVACGTLRSLVDGGLRSAAFGSYDRYIHGLSAAAALTLAAMSVGEARKLFSFLTYALAWGGVLIGLWLVLRKSSAAYRALAVAVVCACFAQFYGLSYFAPSFCYAPPAIVQLSAVLLFLVFDPFADSPLPGAVLASLFGALTAYFEFLTGGAPLGLAILMGMIGASAYGNRNAPVLKRGVFLCAVYVLSFAACFLIKYLLTWLFVDAYVWSDVMQGVSLRLRGESHKPYDVVSVAKSLYWYLPYIGIQPRPLNLLGIALLVAAAGAASTVLWRTAQDESQRLGLIALVASVGVIGVWYLLFLQHTAVHAFFMVRLMVWPVTVLILLIAMGLFGRVAPQPSRDRVIGAN